MTVVMWAVIYPSNSSVVSGVLYRTETAARRAAVAGLNAQIKPVSIDL